MHKKIETRIKPSLEALKEINKKIEEIKKEIKPCPFCGKYDLIFWVESSKDGSMVEYSIHHTAKSKCSVSMIAFDYKELIEMWNRRA